MLLNRMNSTSKIQTVLAIMLVVLPTAAYVTTAEANTGQYIEDFTTITYEDIVMTDAWWDVGSGELKFHPFAPSVVGNYDLPTGYMYNVVVSGDFAYVVDMNLIVVDISDPANPDLEGSCATPGAAMDVKIAGDYAYVADSGRLTVVDISNPASPTVAGSYYRAGTNLSLDVSGNYAFVAYGDLGLVLFDIGDPTSPTYAGTYDTGGLARDVTVDGDYAYVADGAGGLVILDVSGPIPATLVGSYTTSYAQGVAVAGDHAYIADNYMGLVVIDISTPSAPTFLASYGSTGRRLKVVGDYVYMAAYTAGLQVFEISQPASPVLLDAVSFGGGSNLPNGVAVDGEYALVTCGSGGLFVSRIAGTVVPPDYVRSWGSHSNREIIVDGDYLYHLSDYQLSILDITNLDSPVVVSTDAPLPTSAISLALAGDYAYVGGHSATYTLTVLDVSDPSTPSPVDTAAVTFVPYHIVIDGDYAYVGVGNSGLDVFDIEDPTNVVPLTNYDPPKNIERMELSGDLLFCAGNAIQIIDITTPAAPTLVGSYSPASGAYLDPELFGDLLYTASVTEGVVVFDVSDPTNPTPVGDCPTITVAGGVAAQGDHAFVSASQGLAVLDITSPTSPVYLGSDNIPASGHVLSWGDFVISRYYGRTTRVFDRLYWSQLNTAQSLWVNDPGLTIVSVRLATTQVGSIQWEISADNGSNWEFWAANDEWDYVTVPGDRLKWRATLNRSIVNEPAVCSQLELNWLFDVPTIRSVTDIPDDQGRRVRVSWNRSGYDDYPTSTPIVQYAVYRRWDEGAAAPGARSSRGGEPKRPSALPPGDWDFVTTVPAALDERYSVVVPTLHDSTITDGMHHSVFFVSAMTATPGVVYDSPPDSGYSLDNLSPTPPQNLAVAQNTGSGNTLTWDECPDADFQYFCIYRSDDPDFIPGPQNLVDAVTTAGWVDPDFDGWGRHYKITAVDFSGNESDASSAQTVTGVSSPEVPTTFALHQNVPNPFNPVTSISFDVPQGGGLVTVRIYDAGGRLVRTLVDGFQSPGRKSVEWDGRDNRGRAAASGVYFYRMTAPGFDGAKKMLLLN